MGEGSSLEEGCLAAGQTPILLVNANDSQYQLARFPGTPSAIVPGPDRVVLDLHRELHRRRIRGRIERAAVAHVELRAVQHALDGRFLAIEAAGGELEVL